MQTNVIPPEKALQEKPEGSFRVNEVFYSIQGEGRNVGTPMVFVRFSDCNLRCTRTNAGFDCDTEFVSGVVMDAQTLLDTMEKTFREGGGARAEGFRPWALLTGGEPGLQVTEALVQQMHMHGWRVAIETNGTISLPDGIDYTTISPKSADHTLRQRVASEVRYVRQAGQALPPDTIQASWHYISPAFQPDGSLRKEDLEWCLALVKGNPRWMISLQMHKMLGVR